MADELVHVTEYEQDWPDRFDEQRPHVAAIASVLRAAGLDPPARARLPE
jgi:hypothetical protein